MINYKINTNKFIIITIHIFLILLVSLLGLNWVFTSSTTNLEGKIFIFCWVNNLLLIWYLYSWKKLNFFLFTPYILFLIISFIFFLGQPFLFSLGLEYERFNLFQLFDLEQLLSSIVFTGLGLSFLHLGALIISGNKVGYEIQFSNVNIENKGLLKSIKVVGLVLFIISIFPFMSHYMNVAMISIESGYSALYEERESLNIMGTIRLFFIPGCFLLLIAYKKNRFWRVFITSLLMISVVLGYIGGGRGQSTALIISYLWLWHVQIKPLNGKKTLILTIFGFFFLVLLNTISIFRGTTQKSISDFFNLFREVLLNENPIINIIGEMGASMLPLVQVMSLLPEFFTFKYGLTFLMAIFMVLPRVLRFGIDERAEMHELVSLSEWLMNALNMNYGPGFSLVAEAFYNFGWLGIPFMTFYGIVAAYLMRSKAKTKDKLIMKNVFAAVILYFVIMMIRGSSLLLLKYQVYYVVLPVLGIMLIYSYLQQRAGHKTSNLYNQE